MFVRISAIKNSMMYREFANLATPAARIVWEALKINVMDVKTFTYLGLESAGHA
jgi:hypothetical protein